MQTIATLPGNLYESCATATGDVAGPSERHRAADQFDECGRGSTDARATILYENDHGEFVAYFANSSATSTTSGATTGALECRLSSATAAAAGQLHPVGDHSQQQFGCWERRRTSATCDYRSADNECDSDERPDATTRRNCTTCPVPPRAESSPSDSCHFDSGRSCLRHGNSIPTTAIGGAATATRTAHCFGESNSVAGDSAAVQSDPGSNAQQHSASVHGAIRETGNDDDNDDGSEFSDDNRANGRWSDATTNGTVWPICDSEVDEHCATDATKTGD